MDDPKRMGDIKGIHTFLPEVNRARDCRLYDRKGNRYLDLWRNGGRALLGHRPDRVYKELKNVLQKGIVAEYPSVYTSRLKKALRALIPGSWEIRIFASRDRALSVAKGLLYRNGEGAPLQTGDQLKDQLRDQGKDIECINSHHGPSSTATPPIPQSKEQNFLVVEPFLYTMQKLVDQEYDRGVFYRPFLSFPYSRFPVVVPVLPFPGAFAPQPLLIGEPFSREELPPDDPVSPVLSAALACTVWHLIRAYTSTVPKWEDWELPGWNRITCYGVPQFDLSRYNRVFVSFLERKILIPPTPEDPLILPMEWSKGEKALVERTAKELFG